MEIKRPLPRWRLLPALYVFLLCSGPLLLWGANRTAAPLGGTATTFPDGNFENPVLGSSPGFAYSPVGSAWTFASGAGLSRNNTGFTGGNPGAPQGSQVAFLQGNGRVFQTLDLVAGPYRFDFYAAQRGNHQASSQTIELKIDGQTVQTFTPAGTSYQLMTSSVYYLSSGAHSIELRGLNPNGGDNTAFVDRFRYTRAYLNPISGFESPVVTAASGFQYAPSGGPWTFANGAGLSKNNSGFTSGNPNAPEGQQVLFLQGGGTATRSISIAQSGFYRFRIKAALRANHPATGNVKNIRLTIDGLETAEFQVPSTNYTELASAAIYLTTGNHTLVLKGVNPQPGDHTGFVDDLRSEMVHDWQDPVVWGGAVPGSSDVATIGSNSAVGLRGTVNANRIVVNGHLLAAQNQNVSITAKNILASGNQSLIEFGQALAPYTRDASITLNAQPNDPDVGAMGNNFLGAMSGGQLDLHGEEKTSWTQLGQNAPATGSQIVLKEAVNWEVGDEILIVSSRKNWNEAEKRTITGISGGGTTLNLSSPLTYPHTGEVKPYTDGSRNWTADLRAEVGLLSHNIRVQGADAQANAAGYGGHIMVMMDGKAFVSGVELYQMGQKSILGRYPFHWHMLGSAGAGQYFVSSSVHRSFNRAITIHGTESTLVQDNFCYDHIGHGLFLEDGSERFNVIRKNVVLHSKRPAPGEELTPSDNQFNQVQNRTPSSFWITNPQNTFEENVAAGTEGTGFWFAFPTKPMGLSASDPRFSSMQPHTLPLISFDKNSAHSCMSAFDIFDQLNPDHSIKTNWGWANSANHYMDNCLWYANDLAVYTGIGVGGPVENLIFRNNVFVENKVATMLASYSKVDGSCFVANSGENLLSGERYGYRVYDGAGQVLNSHFIGWNASNANFLLNTGAAIKHPNHLFNGNTTDHSGQMRCVLPNFDIAPTTAGANDPGHPRFWSIVLRDVDGGITGQAGSSLVSNHPFLLVGDEVQPSNWTRTYRSPHRFALSLLNYGISPTYNPNVAVTRSKAGTPTESVYYIDGFKEHHQLPFIVNEGYLYTYTYESLPSSKRVNMHMMDATPGDQFLVRYTDFGKLGGLQVLTSSGGSVPSYSSLTSLNNASSTGYYREANGDLYFKWVATARDQRFDLKWSTNFAVPALDTDGDEMPDGEEIAGGRHPFDASDLAAEFALAGDFEGWSTLNNISGGSVSNGTLKGTSINNGDAMVINSAFNFAAAEVPYLKVRMKASQNTGVQVFFATSAAQGYSGTRVVSASYSGNGAWQTLTFPMAGHSSWTQTVTDLRLDVVSGVNIAFEVDWIRASATAKSASFSGEHFSERKEARAWPNPFGDQVQVEWPSEWSVHTVQLLDLHGKILLEANPTTGLFQTELNTGQLRLPAGVYQVRLLGADQLHSLRLVKQ